MRGRVLPLLLVVFVSRALPAQLFRVGAYVPIGSEADERQRLDQLTSSTADPAYLFRSAATLSRDTGRTGALSFAFLGPVVRMVYNSALPYSLNEGSLWAGRGTNSIVTVGVDARFGPLRIVLLPQLTSSENRPFQVIPYSQSAVPVRSVWANPFHGPGSSLDLPLRFGDRALKGIAAGQSSIRLELNALTVGVATENVWWGPGIRNALVLSDNAAGFPHLFVQTRDGVRTSVGRFDAQMMLGELRESNFFDADPSNNVRSLSGLVVVWTPPFDSTLSVGLARTVLATASPHGPSLGAVFDVFRSVGQPDVAPTDPVAGSRRDQLTSFFARWAVPGSGAEAYAEWARFEEPVSLRDLLEFPGHSQGYTLGLQWTRAVMRGGRFRLQAEITNVEPDASVRVRPVATSYTSRAVPQGFTNLGNTLGASIEPGSSSQWVGADVFAPTFRFGAFVSRIRWDNATLWGDPNVPYPKNEDVSLLGGVRGSVRLGPARLMVEYTSGVRLDYLFQDKNANYAAGTHAGVDIKNRTLAVTLSSSVGH